MDKVCVLMSTYNGEAFVEEQIESILKQKGVELCLVVRDDGSSDGTLDILERYKKKGLLDYSYGENLGYAGSFMRLLKNAPQCDYYAFSDQDDIWLDEKLAKAVRLLKEVSSNKKLYCSNLQLYLNGRPIGLMRPHNTTTDEYRCLNSSICTGCTVVIDGALRDVVIENQPKGIKVHDLWLFHTALFLGQFVYDDNAYIFYRQHQGNQIGAKYSFWSKLKKRFKSLKTLPKQHEREEEAKLLINTYREYLTEEQLAIITEVADYKKSITKRIQLVLNKKYGTNIFDKTRILLGVY